VLIIKH